MAGSKKFFVYTTDAGVDFALLADESNTEAVNGGTQDYATGVSVQYTIPGNIRPRHAIYRSADGNRTIKCYALTTSVYSGIGTGVTSISDPIGTGSLTLVRLVPERISIVPIAADTGLNDGDDT